MYRVVVDLEATCCENNEFPRSEMEIIEIGAVLLNEDLETVGHFQSFVKPEYNKTLTDFCTGLTGIKQESVDTAKKFSDVMVDFYVWIESETNLDFTLESWGDFDKNILNREMSRKLSDRHHRKFGVITSIHVNLKEKFAHDNKCRPMGVQPALRKKGLIFVGDYHRALDDAINIKRIMYGD